MTDVVDKLSEMAHAESKRLAGMDKHGWFTGRLREIRTMQIDTKGRVGENFVVWLLKQMGLEVEHLQGTDPTNEPYDIRVVSDDITLEVKTATLGFSTNTFQHEGLEQNRRCDGIIFLDIAPDEVYMTLYCKHTFDWSSAHRRRHGIQYKKDLRLQWLKDQQKAVRSVDDFSGQYQQLLTEVRAARKQK